MKLSQWAKREGIHYQTAWKWFKQGLIPNSRQMPTGSIFVDDAPSTKETKTFIYCRVSNFSRKAEMEYQVVRCSEFCSKSGIPVQKVFKEVASGMNDSRRELWKMINSNPTRIVVEHKDRLSRFGFVYLKNLLAKLGCEIVVINESVEDREDLLKDMVSIIYSFCARLYGMRRAYNKAQKIREIAAQ